MRLRDGKNLSRLEGLDEEPFLAICGGDGKEVAGTLAPAAPDGWDASTFVDVPEGDVGGRACEGTLASDLQRR